MSGTEAAFSAPHTFQCADPSIPFIVSRHSVPADIADAYIPLSDSEKELVVLKDTLHKRLSVLNGWLQKINEGDMEELLQQLEAKLQPGLKRGHLTRMNALELEALLNKHLGLETSECLRVQQWVQEHQEAPEPQVSCVSSGQAGTRLEVKV